MQKIAIIEDDEKLRKELGIFLKNNGYAIIELDGCGEVLDDMMKQNPDLVCLDINLPNVDGIYLLRQLRKISNIPVIMITSRDNETDELISMNFGADYYVTKPFHVQILLAKIMAVLKRAQGLDINQTRIDCDSFILNVSQSCIETDDKKIELTKNELKILHYLIQNKGKILSREEIMNYLWDSESFIDDNTLTVNMTRLRGKLEELGIKEYIETKRGQGYIIK